MSSWTYYTRILRAYRRNFITEFVNESPLIFSANRRITIFIAHNVIINTRHSFHSISINEANFLITYDSNHAIAIKAIIIIRF